MFLKSTSFEFSAKIMGGNYFFYVNPTSHLNRYLTNTYTIILYLTNPNQYLPIFNCYLPIGCIDDCTIVYIVQRIVLVKPDFNLIQKTLTL